MLLFEAILLYELWIGFYTITDVVVTYLFLFPMCHWTKVVSSDIYKHPLQHNVSINILE